MANTPDVNPAPKDAKPDKPAVASKPNSGLKQAVNGIYSLAPSSVVGFSLPPIVETMTNAGAQGTNLDNSDEKKHKVSSEHPLTGLSDPRIEKAIPSNVQSHLQARLPDQVNNIKFEIGPNHSKTPPNYIIEADGKIKEVIPPDKTLNTSDKSIVIQIDPGSDGKISSTQTTEVKQLVACVQKDYTNALPSDTIPQAIKQALNDEVVPVKMPVSAPVSERGGSVHATEAGGVKQWGGNGGTLGGNGSFFAGGDVPHSYQVDGGAGTYQAPYDFSKVPGGPLDLNNPVDKVAALISSNEGNPTTINWNDNGAGVSVGMFQANQKVGELPMLFQELADTPEGYALLVKIFGPKLAKEIKDDPNIIRKLDFAPNNELGKDLEKLVQSSVFQGLELKILRAKVETASQIAKSVGVTSTEGVAIVADMINQFGQSGASRFIDAANHCQGQAQKIEAMVEAVSAGSKYGARYVADMHKASHFNLSANTTFKSSKVVDA